MGWRVYPHVTKTVERSWGERGKKGWSPNRLHYLYDPNFS